MKNSLKLFGEMMKNLLLVLFIIFISNTIALAKDFELSTALEKNRAKFYEILIPCENLFNQADKTNNANDYITACKCALKQDTKSLNFDAQKDYKNLFYKLLVEYYGQRYDITQNKKYADKAYVYANKAVKNRVGDIKTIKKAIILSAYKLKPSKMINAYDYLCTLNSNECKKYYNDYRKMLESTNKLIAEQKENNAKAWAEALSGAARSFNDGYARQTVTNCYGIGNSINCYSY